MSNLFDDEDEQEYKPQEQQQEQQQETPVATDNPYAQEAQQPAADNPYAQDAQNVQQNNELFAGDEEEEYKPQEVEEPANPYGQQEMPMGFGAERANLMGEAGIQMPADSSDMTTGAYQESTQGSDGTSTDASDLSNRANNAKTQLIQEILAFNNEREQVENAKEDHKDDSEQQSLVFTVREPVKVGKITKYTVTGRDSQGEWNCQRRYNEFEKLYAVLVERWPGCYIPAIPEKIAVTIDVQNMKMADNNDAEFVEGRRTLLEKFIREISHFDYLIESREFQIFARGAGEVTAQLDALEAQRPIEVLEKYRLNFSIDEDQANSEMLAYKEKITVFGGYLTKAYVALEKQAEAFRKFSVNYDQSHQHYKKIYLNLMAFEDMAIDSYSDGDRTKRVLSHPIAQDLPVQITESIEKWRNPFKDAWLTLRGELLDVKAMMHAMNGRSAQETLMTKAETRQRDKKTELEKMTLGKTTLKSFFKSKSTITKDIDSYSATIQQLDVDIDQYKKLVNFITIFHGQIAIDKFKRLKTAAYYKMLNTFSIKEVSNAHLHATLAHSILEMQDQC